MAESSTTEDAALAVNTTRELVTDGASDVAMTKDFEKMMTEGKGRRPFQRVYLWTTTDDNEGDADGASSRKKATSATYNVAKDGPLAAGPCPLLPQNEELFEDNSTKPYLEVGIMLGEEPKKYLPEGASRSKPRETARKQRGILRRDEHAMRVFVPVHEFIQKQAKFYVGCRPQGGRLFPRVAESGYLTRACRTHAAVNNTEEGRPTAIIARDEVEKSLLAHPLVVTKAEHLSSLLVLQMSLFDKTQDEAYLKAMIDTVEKISPDLKYGLHTSSEGIDAFMDFETQLTNELASSLIRELKVANPHIQTLDPGVIMTVHGELCHMDKGDAQSLYPTRLGYFLEVCHLTIVTESPNEYVTKEVSHALQTTQIHHRHVANPGIWTGPIPGEHSEAQLSQAEYLTVLSAVRHYVQSVDERANRAMDAIAAQHGGVLKHASLNDLMAKMSNTVDAVTLGSLLEQLGVLHAGVSVVQNRETTELLRELISYLDKIIVTTQAAA